MADSGEQLTRFDICRPIRSGLTESVRTGSFTPAGISGILMRVDTASRGSSALVTTQQYTPGRIIRVATNRAYTANDTIGLGADITQPASGDGGSLGTVVGQSCAQVPFNTDSQVDVAARTARIYNENPVVHLTDTETNRVFGVHRNYASLLDTDVQVYHRFTASGEETGTGIENLTVTEVPGVAGDAGEATMTYSVDGGTTTTSQTFTGQIITEAPTEATESAGGSPVVSLMDEAIAGIFVGISDSGDGVVTPIASIEGALGAQTVTGLRLSSLEDH